MNEINELDMRLLKIYASILDTCNNDTAKSFIINRVFRILRRKFKDRKPSDFPETSDDLQIVYLVSYIREEKLAYAYLYASSLTARGWTRKHKVTTGQPLGIWARLSAWVKRK